MSFRIPTNKFGIIAQGVKYPYGRITETIQSNLFIAALQSKDLEMSDPHKYRSMLQSGHTVSKESLSNKYNILNS